MAKRLSIPSTIKVGPHQINVRFVDVPDHSEPGEFVFGTWNIKKLEIQIRKGLDPSMEWETFWHEVMECINEMTDAELPHTLIQTFGLLLSDVCAGMKICNCQKLNERKAKQMLETVAVVAATITFKLVLFLVRTSCVD